MIRILSLLWTLIIALVVTALSFFYIRGDLHGFPLAFAKDVSGGGWAGSGLEVNTWIMAFDLIIWWLLFSILWIVFKNYIFDL